MDQRFFRSDETTYEAVRLSLDSQWGHPSNIATTCFEPAATAPKDSRGRVLLAVLPQFCELAAVAEALPQLLASGAVEEISQAEYVASIPQTSYP